MYIEIALDEADGTDVWSQQIKIAVNEGKMAFMEWERPGATASMKCRR
jgi:hypothetical protein